MRIDIYLYEKGFCTSRNKAKTLIEENRVTINGIPCEKCSYDVLERDMVEVLPSESTEFVGRGGYKLEYALEDFGIDVKNKICADIGASTGGFTQCLLMKGAKKVFAVDSGKDQLSLIIKNDCRVVNIEGFNARNLTLEQTDNTFCDIVVMDVSFISQTLLYPAVLRVAKKGADVVTLIKPQFEVGRQNIGKHGVVKSRSAKLAAVENIIQFAKNSGFEYISHTTSPIKGGDGNEEFLLYLKVK